MTQLPFPKEQQSSRPPQFSAHFYCGQTAGCIRMPLGMEVGLSPGNFVLDGDPAPPPNKRGHSPKQFSAHAYCDQTSVCIRIPLGTEVGPSLGHLVLDGDPARPPLKGHSPSILGPCSFWPNGLMDEDATWYESRPRPRPHCVRRGPSSPSERGTAALSFRPMSIVATVAHLSYC